MNKTIINTSLAALLSTGIATAYADGITIFMHPKKIIFNPYAKKAKRTLFISLENVSKKTAYISMSVFDLSKNMDTQTQKETLQKSFGIIALPRKMIVKPGRTKRLSITNLITKSKVERDFNLQFIFAKVPKKYSFETTEEKKIGIQVKTKVITHAYVYVLPAKQEVKTNEKWDADKQALKLTNEGTMSVKYYAGHQCIKEKCKALQQVFLTPGQTKYLELPDKNMGEIIISRETVLNRISPLEMELG